MIREYEPEYESDYTNICVIISILYNTTLYCTQALCNDWLRSDQSKLFYLFFHYYVALYLNKVSLYVF
jgi:hypothetical protein